MVHLVWLKKGVKGEYCYLAQSFRVNGKVTKHKRYFGNFSDERLSLKDLIWFLKGKEGIMWLKPEEQQKWLISGTLQGISPLCNITIDNEGALLSHKEIETMIKNLLTHVGLAPCGKSYIIKHGIPATFKKVFDDYNLTDRILSETIRLAQFYTEPDFVLFEPNEYFEGRPEDYERARQFLNEDRETQLKPK